MLAAAYLILIIFIIAIQICRPKTGRLDFLTFFNVFFLMLYPIPGFFLVTATGKANLEMSFSGTQYLNLDNFQTPLAIFMSYLLIVAGFYASPAVHYGNRIALHPKGQRRLIGFALALLFISILGIYVYSAQYGGVASTVAHITEIRAGVKKGGNLVFFKQFMPYSFFASFLFGSMVLQDKLKENKLFLYSVFVISVIASVLGVTITGTRSPFLFYAFIFYAAYSIKKKTFFSWSTVILSGFSFVLILYGKELFWSIGAFQDGIGVMQERFVEAVQTQREIGSGFEFYRFLRNFVYPVHSLDAAFNAKYDLRLFLDWIYGIMQWIPERLTGIEKPLTVGQYNTYHITGYLTGRPTGVPYGIPPGMLAFGIYSLSWPGLILVGFLYGWVGRFLQTVLNNHITSIYWMIFIYPLIAVMWLDFLAAGDPRIFFVAHFWSMTSLVVMFLFVAKISFAQSTETRRSSTIYES